ncbi:hypothetical protein F8M41_014391 [Gigaspora margarita]|uniref:Uncharacterized protein n=1 Tax=Gigaspora margarita TaxID=4874 RepID=A0A8H4ARF6_GIGMA|nr:hypothetical protein F8M41_014391 [Gigaspora margarita]
MDSKDLPPRQTFNFIFEYGLFILIIAIYLYIQDWEKLRLKRHSFPQRVLGNESWGPQFIYPNHWRGGSTTNVSRQVGYNWQPPHIISTSTYAIIAIYLTIVYTLSLMWEPPRRICEIKDTSAHLY